MSILGEGSWDVFFVPPQIGFEFPNKRLVEFCATRKTPLKTNMTMENQP